MRLYRSRIEAIAQKVIKVLTEGEHIEVQPTSQLEAFADLEAVMVEYLKREQRLRDAVRTLRCTGLRSRGRGSHAMLGF